MMRANMGIILEQIARETGREPLGFNFAAPLLSVEFDRRLLEDVLIPIKPPRLVVLGLLPQNLLFEERPELVDRVTRSLPAFAMHAGTPAARIQELLFLHSDLFRYRQVIHDTLLGVQRDIPFWDKLGREVNRHGDIATMAAVQPVRSLTVWERRYVAQFAEFDDLLANTTLFEHIAALARTCRAHGIQLVLLNSAMHPIALQQLPNGAEDLARFVAAVHATADALGVTVVDAVPGGIGPPEMFSDAAHPNVDGVRWMSEQIGHDLVARGLLDGQPRAAPTPSGA
jgi:hypothetical protein